MKRFVLRFVGANAACNAQASAASCPPVASITTSATHSGWTDALADVWAQAIASSDSAMRTHAACGAASAARARQTGPVPVPALCMREPVVVPLLGWLDDDGQHQGAMPVQEQIFLAAHLLRHGMVGTATKADEGGRPAAEFNVAEYVAAARIHLQMSAKDAEALSMSEFQALFEMRFPDAKKKKREVPTREEYRAAMAAMT